MKQLRNIPVKWGKYQIPYLWPNGDLWVETWSKHCWIVRGIKKYIWICDTINRTKKWNQKMDRAMLKYIWENR